MRTSAAGIHLITEFEGFPNGGRPYNDPVGLATVGYGHLIARRRVTDADRRARWLPGQQAPGILTQTEAEALLRQDLAPREAAVARLVQAELTQGQFDAMVSLVFNIGEGNLATSTVLRKLNAGAYQAAADAFLMWNKAGSPLRPLAGLTRRRQAERAMFLADSRSAAAAVDALSGYTASEVRWIREYDELKRDDRDIDRRRVLRRVMTEQRKLIWRSAQPADRGGDGRGWDVDQRRERYHSLLVRTS